MATPSFVRPNKWLPPCDEVSAVAAMSEWLLLRADAKTATTDPDDPAALSLASATAANDLLHRIIQNPGLPYLDLALLCSGATSPSGDTVVNVYGFTPIEDLAAGGGGASLLSDADSTNFDLLSNATLLGPMLDPTIGKPRLGLWEPLFRPSDSSFAQTFAAATAPEWDKDSTASSSHRLKMVRQDRHVYCGGCTHILCTIVSGTVGPTAALLLGRFSS